MPLDNLGVLREEVYIYKLVRSLCHKKMAEEQRGIQDAEEMNNDEREIYKYRLDGISSP